MTEAEILGALVVVSGIIQLLSTVVAHKAVRGTLQTIEVNTNSNLAKVTEEVKISNATTQATNEKMFTVLNRLLDILPQQKAQP